MTWRQLLDWVNDPSRTNTDLRDAKTALEASGVTIPRLGSYRTRLQAAIASQPNLDAPSSWIPAEYAPPAPIAQPVQAATPIQQNQVPPQAQVAPPVQTGPTVVTTNTERSSGMKALAGAIVAVAIIILAGLIIINEPWNDDGTSTTVSTQSNVTQQELDTKLDNLKEDILKAIPSTISTPAPTIVYQQPAAPAAPAPSSPPAATQVPSSSLSVPVPAANCWTTAEAKALTGVDVQRIGTEPCAWVWRAVGVGATSAQCPEGALCTFDTGNGIYVDMGAGSRTIVAGTWRKVDSYSQADAVHRPCELLAKEQQFGRQEDPSFEVHAGNGLNCTN